MSRKSGTFPERSWFQFCSLIFRTNNTVANKKLCPFICTFCLKGGRTAIVNNKRATINDTAIGMCFWELQSTVHSLVCHLYLICFADFPAGTLHVDVLCYQPCLWAVPATLLHCDVVLVPDCSAGQACWHLDIMLANSGVGLDFGLWCFWSIQVGGRCTESTCTRPS